MDGSRIRSYITLSECPICGKRFIPAPEHIYKIPNGGSYKYVCSWGCQRKYERKKSHESA